MDAKTCIEKLRLCGVLDVATVDADGLPQVRCISAVHYDGTDIYMLTSRGKNVAREWEENGNVQLLVHTRFNEMIRVSGKVQRVPENEQAMWRDKIYDAQPYLTNVYPGNTREINVIDSYMRLAVAKPSQKATKLQRLALAVALASANALKMQLVKVSRMLSIRRTACTVVVAMNYAKITPSSDCKET
jgi:uncharacterized pyridoxamine 5'-phosphate oxidase family protein